VLSDAPQSSVPSRTQSSIVRNLNRSRRPLTACRDAAADLRSLVLQLLQKDLPGASHRERSHHDAQGDAVRRRSRRAGKSIAVLYFENMSSTESDYFCPA